MLIGALNPGLMWLALIAIFVSGAVAPLSLAAYGAFTAIYTAMAALYALREARERVLEHVASAVIGVGLIWASDNTIAAKALATLARDLVAPAWSAVAQALGSTFALGGAFVSLLTFSILAPRLISLGEEAPLIAVGYTFVATSVIGGLIAPLPDAVRLALGLALIPTFGRALRGNIEALGELAPMAWLLPLDPMVVAQIAATMAVVELALGLIGRRHLAAAALWASTAMVISGI